MTHFFQCRPLAFAQMYSVHTLIDRTAVPAVYALMGDKTESSYATLFRAIKNKIPNWAPNNVICDFEIAAIKGITRVIKIYFSPRFFIFLLDFPRNIYFRLSFSLFAMFVSKSLIFAQSLCPFPRRGILQDTCEKLYRFSFCSSPECLFLFLCINT